MGNYGAMSDGVISDDSATCVCSALSELCSAGYIAVRFGRKKHLLVLVAIDVVKSQAVLRTGASEQFA